jgi:hypothetical protein
VNAWMSNLVTVTESIQSVLPKLGHNSHVTLLSCVRVCPCNNVQKIFHYYVPRKELSIVAEFKLEPGCWTCGLDASLTATVRIPKDPGVRCAHCRAQNLGLMELHLAYQSTNKARTL